MIYGIARHEFGMQIRRPVMWLIEVGTALLLLTGLHNPWNFAPGTLLDIEVGNWAVGTSLVVLLGYGIALADRAARERGALVELLGSQPTAVGARALGKYIGSTLASLMPVIAVYAAGVGWMLLHLPFPAALVLARAGLGFVAVVLPAALFVAAISLSCPTFLPVTLYQVLFVGYWLWASMLNPKLLPTTSNTLFNPVGVYAGEAFFHVAFPWVARATTVQALLNVGLIVTVAAIFVVLLSFGMRRRVREIGR